MKAVAKRTQNDRLLTYLKINRSITQLEAMERLGIMRLGARILDLRRRGHAIRSERLTVIDRFGAESHPARYHYEGPGL